MALTRLQIEFLVRHTRFNYDGKVQDLTGDAGYAACEETLLWEIINQAVIDVNMELEDDVNELTTNCVKDSDEIAPPPDFLAIRDVIIYPDYDDSSSPSGSSSYKKGTPLQKVASYAKLIESAGYETDHGVKITGSTTPGMPTAYMLWRRDNADVIKFNRTADHGYYVDVLYYTIPANLSDDNASPEVKDAYQWLIVEAARAEVANLIGDERGYVRFNSAYNNRLKKYKRKVNKRTNPVTTKPNNLYI